MPFLNFDLISESVHMIQKYKRFIPMSLPLDLCPICSVPTPSLNGKPQLFASYKHPQSFFMHI